jgi:hypothetical protein
MVDVITMAKTCERRRDHKARQEVRQQRGASLLFYNSLLTRANQDPTRTKFIPTMGSISNDLVTSY